MDTETAKCDFCSQRPVVWRIPCPDFEIVPGASSAGDFLACQPCGVLIQQADREGLIDRSVLMLQAEGLYQQAIQIIHDQFWRYADPAAMMKIV